MPFTYPENLVTRLQVAWATTDYKGQEVAQIPKTGHLKEFLEIAYHASMFTEEARQIDFRIAFISREEANQLAGPEEFGRLYEPVTFTAPREFSVKEILRLAPATDHTNVLICVSPVNGHSDNGELPPLNIWGLINTGSSWWEFTQRERKTGVPPPNCLSVSSSEPGNLTISREGSVLLNLKKGQIITPSSQTLYKGPIADFLEDALTTLDAEIIEKIGADSFSINNRGEDFPREFYFRFIERLLFKIREKRHGGAVLVIPDNATDDCSMFKGLMVKYPCNYSQVWSLIIKSLSARYKYHQLFLDFFKGETESPIVTYHQMYSTENLREEVDHRITDSVQLFASSSGVDGAILMTDKLRLLGFGTEITVQALALKEVHLAKNYKAESMESVPIESYGTRHRSAFRFCWANPDSIAFVISQDGDVKGVKRIEDKLVFWPDINFGPLGI